MSLFPFDFVLASALVAVGCVGYLRTGRKSKTALIPAAFGLIVAVVSGIGLGWPAAAPVLRWVVWAVAALGALGTLSGARLVLKGTGQTVHVYKALMCGCCLGYMALSALA
jgi:hypothetical protein